MKKNELKIIAFKNKILFNKWLIRSGEKSDGIWLRMYKKDSEIETVTYAEAVEEALCLGWIDGQSKSYDEKSWIQKFTPRRSKSIWSQRNTVIVKKLIEQKRMKPAGLKVIEEAKADGRWQQAYPSPKNMVFPKDFLAELKKHKKAFEFFKTLSKSYLYSIFFKLHTAKKEETRRKRMKNIIESLKKGEKPA